MIRKILLPAIGTILLLISCSKKPQCEKHFIQPGFIGKVKIYFDKKDGQKLTDKNGCIIYHISDKGECFSAFAFDEKNIFIPGMFECFEMTGNNDVKEIPFFDSDTYWQDTLHNKDKKYMFYISRGYENLTGSDPNYVLEYYIDYGVNYKKH